MGVCRDSREEASDRASSANSFNDKLLGSGQLQGQLLGFQQGDYIHAVVRSDEGKIIDFFRGHRGWLFSGDQQG